MVADARMRLPMSHRREQYQDALLEVHRVCDREGLCFPLVMLDLVQPWLAAHGEAAPAGEPRKPAEDRARDGTKRGGARGGRGNRRTVSDLILAVTGEWKGKRDIVAAVLAERPDATPSAVHNMTSVLCGAGTLQSRPMTGATNCAKEYRRCPPAP